MPSLQVLGQILHRADALVYYVGAERAEGSAAMDSRSIPLMCLSLCLKDEPDEAEEKSPELQLSPYRSGFFLRPCVAPKSGLCWVTDDEVCPEIVHLEGRTQAICEALLRKALQLLRERRRHYVVSRLRTQAEVFSVFGFEENDLCLRVQTAKALRNVGSFMEARKVLPEIDLDQLQNDLWVLNLAEVLSGQATLGDSMARPDVLDCHNALFRYFGADFTWIGGFLKHARLDCSFGIRGGDDGVHSASLVGGDAVPSISAVFVNRAERRRGLGRGLLGASLRALQRREVPVVTAAIRADNVASAHLFQSFGFRRLVDWEELVAVGHRAGKLPKKLIKEHFPGKRSQLLEACEEAGIAIF